MAEIVLLGVVLLGTGALVWVSRHCLLHPRTHGFYRFFAFESILLLIVFNIQYWFVEPFSGNQIASWVLLILSAILAIQAFWLIRVVGRPATTPTAGPDFAFEQTTKLVTAGAYRFIRHPMYSSLLYLAWGAFLKQITIPTAILVAVASLSLCVTALVEEKENILRFGEPYRNFMKQTKRFIPFVW